MIGHNIRLNGIDFTVVGVAPESLHGLDQYIRPALFVPVMMKQRLDSGKENSLENRNSHDFAIKARLKSGASLGTARARSWRPSGVTSSGRIQTPIPVASPT